MPELPEVETIARRLQEVLPGKTILNIQVLHSKSFFGDGGDLQDSQILKVSRRGKSITIHTSAEQDILIHLKMTGQLIYQDSQRRVGGGHPTADWTKDLPGKHTRVVLNLSDNAKLFFNDQRLFGWIKAVTASERTAYLHALGPDVIDPEFSAAYFYPLLQRKRIPIKVALLDAALVAGIGNIYVCDALNLAKISPLRPCITLSYEEVERLVAASKAVIAQGIELGGTTFDGKYVTVDGLAGKYQSVVRVYGRQGEPCFNCGSLIEKIMIIGRGTYLCSGCQV